MANGLLKKVDNPCKMEYDAEFDISQELEPAAASYFYTISLSLDE